MTSVVVLGAGPAGLAAALELAESGVKVTLVEQNNYVGGNASSFEMGGINVDYGSHRLHPASAPQVLDRIKQVLGDDLLVRPRHGRILLMGRWIHFPLRPIDLVFKAHPLFVVGVGGDLIKKLLSSKPVNSVVNESFASILKQGLGKTICNTFYFPYAKKIWGVDPNYLSPIQARKRVSAGSIGKMFKRLLPGGTALGGASSKGVFYYPRYGFGQISRALQEKCIEAGVDIRLNSRIIGIQLDGTNRYVEVESKGYIEKIPTNQIYSTIPLTLLTKLINTKTPPKVLKAAELLEFRSMILVYLQLDQDQFTEFDAHYFPSTDIPFTRISETKNYSDLNEPKEQTVLCAELPCFRTDELWNMSEQELGSLVSEGLAKAGLKVNSNITDIKLKKIPFAYPLYTTGYEKNFELVDEWLDNLDGLLSFGRQGLYAHDNTHHAMYMAKAAADCLNENGSIDTAAWQAARKIFESHVVED
jgi:protoporphyrinogen oxidase